MEEGLPDGVSPMCYFTGVNKSSSMCLTAVYMCVFNYWLFLHVVVYLLL